MDYSKSILLYQDEPAYGLLLKLIFIIIPAFLLVTGIYLWTSGENEGGPVLLIETLIVALILWIVMPRKYQVYEDHLRIVLGKPFVVKIGFNRIKEIKITSRTAFTVNFVTRTARTYVLISQNRGLGIAITPRSYEMFMDNAGQAFIQWQKMQGIKLA